MNSEVLMESPFNASDYYFSVFVGIGLFLLIFIFIQYHVDKHVHDENLLALATNLALVISGFISLLLLLLCEMKNEYYHQRK